MKKASNPKPPVGCVKPVPPPAPPKGRFKEHDIVKLSSSTEVMSIPKGITGAIVHDYGNAYEVEFTITTVITLEEHKITK